MPALNKFGRSLALRLAYDMRKAVRGRGRVRGATAPDPARGGRGTRAQRGQAGTLLPETVRAPDIPPSRGSGSLPRCWPTSRLGGRPASDGTRSGPPSPTLAPCPRCGRASPISGGRPREACAGRQDAQTRLPEARDAHITPPATPPELRKTRQRFARYIRSRALARATHRSTSRPQPREINRSFFAPLPPSQPYPGL